MGHLKMDKSPGDMRKFVISFWFRVPKATIDKAATTLTGFGTFRVYVGVVPLIAWGEQLTGNRGVAGSGPMPPSYIGVNALKERLIGSNRTTLEVHIQTNNFSSDTDRTWPEYFGNSSIDASFTSAGFPDVLVDHWNHVILSCDLHDHSRATCDMWCSINDKDISGKADTADGFRGLPAMGAGVDGAGPNKHCTSAILGMDGAVSVGISNIPSKPFCVPAPGSVDIDDGSMNPVLKVEMAELQVFTGVTIDTGVTANRRAFVDNDGVPVAPLPSVDGDGNPVPPPAARLLGKKPEILLTGSGSWSSGYNTGTLGIDADGLPIPSGQFAPTGNILTWAPDPTLHGPQNPAPPPGVRLTKKRNLVTP